MGEIADSIVEGIICESCGMYIGPACGHSRKCDECSGDHLCYDEACELANFGGLNLRRHTDYHYSLRGDGWIINLYPSRHRIHYDSNSSRPIPNVNDQIPRYWNLLDIVKAVLNVILR